MTSWWWAPGARERPGAPVVPEPPRETEVPAVNEPAVSAAGASVNGRPESAPAPPVVELRAVARTYGSDPPVQALRGVDLAVHTGDFVAIVGPSGSGKSTLLNILGCLDRPSSGSYLIDGGDVGALSEGERTAVRARSIGFVFQQFHLLAHRTALENVVLAELYAGGERAGRQERALAALERVGMTHRRDFLPTKLSGGEQQRVAIARALLGTPRLLLCDEPTGNLDSANTESLLLLFDALARQGLTLVVVTHDEEVAGTARRVVRLVDGRIAEDSG
jgi:ABC-type lipoprotein export system ATPase subunit